MIPLSTLVKQLLPAQDAHNDKTTALAACSETMAAVSGE